LQNYLFPKRIILVRVRIAAPEFEQGIHIQMNIKLKPDIRVKHKAKETIILS